MVLFPKIETSPSAIRCASFYETALEQADKSGTFKIHFATAREAFNFVQAAVDQQEAEPELIATTGFVLEYERPRRMNEDSSLEQPVGMSSPYEPPATMSLLNPPEIIWLPACLF